MFLNKAVNFPWATNILVNSGGFINTYVLSVLKNPHIVLTKSDDTPTSIYKATFSIWVRRIKLTGSFQIMLNTITETSPARSAAIYFSTTNKVTIQIQETSTYAVSSTNTITDTNWHHLLIQIDTTQAIDTDRVTLFIDGTEETLTGTYPLQNQNIHFTTPLKDLYVGADTTGLYGLQGYMIPWMIDGQILRREIFAVKRFGVLRMKYPTGISFGAQGYGPIFDNSGSEIGADYYGPQTGVATAADGMSQTESQVSDVPNNSLFVLDNAGKPANVTVLNNFRIESAIAANRTVKTIESLPSTGKWYWESYGDAASFCGGVVADDFDLTSDPTGAAEVAVHKGVNSRSIWIEGTEYTNYFNSIPGVIPIGIMVDRDNNKVSFQASVGQTGTEYTFGSGVTLHPAITVHTSPNIGILYTDPAFIQLSVPSDYRLLSELNLNSEAVGL